MSHIALRGVALFRGGRLLVEGLDADLGESGGLHLVGPNGSGKSSLIRAIAGLLPIAAGSVERSARMALADESLALDRELPLGRALAFWTGDAAADALAALGIGHLADVPVRLLSTGQRKRAALARVVASGAPIWLLDEPFNGLDRQASALFEEMIAAHRAGGGSVVLASHMPVAGDWQRLELAA